MSLQVQTSNQHGDKLWPSSLFTRLWNCPANDLKQRAIRVTTVNFPAYLLQGISWPMWDAQGKIEQCRPQSTHELSVSWALSSHTASIFSPREEIAVFSMCYNSRKERMSAAEVSRKEDRQSRTWDKFPLLL
jgi:hypothetical protein